MTNPLTNAAEYTHEGGLIRVETSVTDVKVHLCVIDSGQGMSPELLTNCFELFVQEERTSERAAGGLGMPALSHLFASGSGAALGPP
jgi:signal transduction histidine kinase